MQFHYDWDILDTTIFTWARNYNLEFLIPYIEKQMVKFLMYF